MSATGDVPEGLIWATRGRLWGFRFLLRGGMNDPLLEYERVFGDLSEEPLAWGRGGAQGGLRFPDPRGRRDAAGRVIPHEFVVPSDVADRVGSAAEGRDQVWPLVAGVYANFWDAAEPPADADVCDAFRLDH
ncbi:hypothetical protein WBG06_00420 [Nocardioides sp. CCNWLW239]|uniref:hypothetical protein n=1 Tax=Nocardioides sp. CCNWLW239 TaxID=3128902 RepID=UPI003016F36D